MLNRPTRKGQPEEPAPPREASLGELALLPLRATVAYAARCARRLQPFFQVPEDVPTRLELIGAVESAILAAEEFARGTVVPSLTGSVVQSAYAVAEMTGELTRNAPYAAAHAARAARLAAEAGEPGREELPTQVVAAAFGASRVLMANVPFEVQELTAAALHADFEALLGLALGAAAEPGRPVDPAEEGPLGPLWAGGAPF